MQEGSDQALYAFFTSLNEDLFVQLDNNQFIFEAYKGNTLVLWSTNDETLTTKQIPFSQKHFKILNDNIHAYADSNHFFVKKIPEEIIEKLP